MPPLRPLDRDLYSRAMTLYDPQAGEWRFVGASDVAGFGPVTESKPGYQQGGDLYFSTGETSRDVFAGITRRTFDWLQQETTDGGQTWNTAVRVGCHRR